MKLCSILALPISAWVALGQVTPTVKQAPPPGIEIKAEDTEALRTKLKTLRKEIHNLGDTLQHKPEMKRLLPDIEVFAKSVQYALDYNEFFKPGEIRAAGEQIESGLARARQLKELRPQWMSATGSVVRAYRSKIDGSVQPYGIRVPDDWGPQDQRPRPLYLWFHGRNDTLTELAFVSEQLKGRREFAPANAFELHLYGRYCNASKFAGEVDAFEALEAVKRDYPIDTRRLAELGFSMGGATAWHLAAHFPGLWAAASAGAGFAETAIYAKVFDNKTDPPPPWEQTLWHWYDAADYAANFEGVRMIAYSGEIDPQKQSADLMERALAAEGLKLERLIGPKTAHKYEPETKKELARRLREAVEAGNDPFPSRIRFVTYTLRYNQMKWITLDRLEKHWQRAEIVADRTTDAVEINTKNISGFTLGLPQKPGRIVVDGQVLTTDSTLRFLKVSSKWAVANTDDSQTLRKVHGLTGPIDDAFMDSFLFVRPTGQALNPQVGSWATKELDRAIVEWRRVFRGDAPVKNDSEITAEDIAQHHLILWGDPGSNQLIARILRSLPVTWTRSALNIGTNHMDAASSAPIMIFPNPLNRERYVVLNSGFTFRQGSTTSNSLQTPKVPDWAMVDLRTPPSVKWPGLIVAAGFFDDAWKLQ